MAISPFGKKPDAPERPQIWAEGGQRPPFVLQAFGRASLLLSRQAVAPIHAWAARRTRGLAVAVKDGAGRIPEERLGRAARFVPSHLRVAAWVQNGAAVLAHASATADPDVPRGNALVAEVEYYLWAAAEIVEPSPADPAPVVLAEPLQPGDDPLSAIRDDLEGAAGASPIGPRAPHPAHPAPPGPVATGAIQVLGYALGWLSSLAALPFGMARAGWLHLKGVDLRRIGAEE
jgi:hypothetical protein